MTTTFEPWSPDAARAILETIDEPGPVLMSLQALQEAFGYVHPDALPIVAETFNVTRADVFGVLTYYSDLRQTMPADVEVRVCLGEACQAVGARALHASAGALMDTSCDVTRVFCMGNCALGPTAVVNGRLIGRASIDRVRAAVEEARS